ncbi:MAG TPA: phosphohistidine phosphatase SixA [Candidatus Kapabacteria bacterium]|nr:phosphohistidine phosphatase SixA [Candidatus Kapabacteria bacterium]
MFVYILRHAIAIPSGTVRLKNDDRPLTKEGKKKMTKAAKGIASLIGNVDLILTSPLIRARDTAKITADVLGVENKIETCEYLAPGSPTKNLLLSLGKYKNFKSILLVGHEPELGFIASALLGSPSSVVRFKKGALCCIEVASLPPNRPGRLIWHLPPKVLRSLA